MRYQNPQLLYALFAIAIPILIHFLNLRKHKKIYFSSVRFLKEIKENKNKRSKLKNLLLLLSRVLAITFLVLAFAKPYMPVNEYNQSNNIFIYIDNSFSMDANDGNGRLLNIAQEKARIITESYSNESNFYLITNDLLSIHNNNYNRNSIIKEIDKVKSSSKIRNVKHIINHQQTINNTKSHLYIISDMQEETIQLQELKNDTNTQIFLVPIIVEKQPNLSIDSCWINNPLLTTQKNIELFVSIENHSSKAIEEAIIFLDINGKQKSQQFINLKEEEKKHIIFNFSSNGTEDIQGKITINDSPISFDNELFFTIKRNKKINILCINEGNIQHSINTIFKQDSSLFNYTVNHVNNIDYNTALQKDLLILNEVTSISSGLLNTINKITEKGGSILIIPAKKTEITTYNNTLEKLGLNLIKSIKEERVEINIINTEHPIFSAVFESKLDKINYPITKRYFKVINNKINTHLLSFDNQQPFLSLYEKEQGLIYVFNSPLNEDINSFVRHSLFVPTLINIATQSIRANHLYNVIDKQDYFTSNYNNLKQEILHLKNNKTDIVPTTKNINAKTYYYIHNQIDNEGIYKLTNKSDTIESIAFNYDRRESDIKTLDITKINDIIKRNKLENSKLISTNLQNFRNEINKERKGKEFWKTALILALLFLAIEILIIKNIKT